jgi:tetratricopeptide (TPR) repeat protein
VRGLLAALLLATAAAYLPALDGEFLYDDEATLSSALVRDPLGQPAGAWLGPRGLVQLTFALDHLAAGADPRVWHLTSLAVHLAATVLAWLLARKTLARAGLASPEPAALTVAALFALHPLQTESVAYLAQRAEALAGAAYLAALLLLLARDEARTAGRRAALLGAALLAQALGALAKPTVATLPVAWLFHAALLPAPGEERWSPLRRVRARLAPALPSFGLAAASAALELSAARGAAHAGFEVPGLPPAAYLATELRVIPTYLRLALWPAGQSADWDFPRSAGFADARVLAGAILLAGLLAGAAWLAARAPRLEGDRAAAARAAAFGVPFFLLTLAPSSSVVPLHDVLAEHRVYLGLLGLSLAVVPGAAIGLGRLLGGRARLAGAALAVALAAALGLATAARAEVWTTRERLWTDVVRKAPGNARGFANLGIALAGAGREGEALAAFREAERLDVDGGIPRAFLLGQIVHTLTTLGRLDEALREVEQELARDPGSPLALALLARIELVEGRLDLAEEAALRALAREPADGTALKIVGTVRARRGDWAGALEPLRGAARASPLDTGVQLDLGRAEELSGSRDAACAAYDRAATERGLAVLQARAAAAFRALGCR